MITHFVFSTNTLIYIVCQYHMMNIAIIIYAVYVRVGMSIYRKALLTEKCMREKTLKLTGYFCRAFDMFTIMIGDWAIPYAIWAAAPRFTKARGLDLFRRVDRNHSCS